MKNLYIACLITLAFYKPVHAQYVVHVQRQVLLEVLNARDASLLTSKKDSLLHAYQKEIADMARTVDACQVLNSDYLTQISYLKQINFDSNKEIIILTKEKKRLKRQTFWLKVLIPIAVGGTIYLMK